MGWIRFVGSASTFAVTFLLVAGDARSITVPDPGSSCTLTSTDGSLKITNTDTGGPGPAFIGMTTSGGYAGLYSSASDPSGYGVHGTASGATASSNIGVYAKGAAAGVDGEATGAR